MATKTNTTINGHDYYRSRMKIGRRFDPKKGYEVDEFKNFYGKSKAEAEAKKREYIEKRKQGFSDSKQFFGIMADKFIYHVFVNDSKYSNTTKELYINAWNKNIRSSNLYGMRLEEVKSVDIQSLYNGLKCSKGTLKCINSLMKHLYHYLEQECYCRDITGCLVLPVCEMDRKKGNSSEIDVWTDKELEELFKKIGDHRLRFFMFLAAGTGLRTSELLALKYNDVKEGRIIVNKQLYNKAFFEEGKDTIHSFEIGPCKSAASVREVPLSDELLKELQNHKKWQRKEMLSNGYRTDYIFTTSSGKFYDRHNVTTACNRFYKKIGIEQKGIHVFRRTFATNLCKSGVPIQVASSLLGHSDISVTAKYYVNIGHDEKKEAVKIISTKMFG